MKNYLSKYWMQLAFLVVLFFGAIPNGYGVETGELPTKIEVEKGAVGTEKVKTWKKVDDLVEAGDDAFKLLKRDVDFLEKFDNIINNQKVNKHVFKGEVDIVGTNSAGDPIYKVTGIHSKDAFVDGTVRVKQGTQIEDLGDGFYKAKVEKQIDGFVNAEGTNWKVKTKKSTFFPDSWSKEKIQAEIARAFKNKTLVSGNKYEGLTTGGKKITMYLDDVGEIKSAFPDI